MDVVLMHLEESRSIWSHQHHAPFGYQVHLGDVVIGDEEVLRRFAVVEVNAVLAED